MTNNIPNDPVAKTAFAETKSRIVAILENQIKGKPEAIQDVLITLLSRGHLLIEDVPGTGKTSLAKALSRAIGGDSRRIQFTPDLLPSDITGVSVFDQSNGTFKFQPGPIFSNIVLADEINRASPRTQSALLQAMEESMVTADGVDMKLPNPFMVIATQNPIEHYGTFPLPEAQLDRFQMRISLGYPDLETEIEILNRVNSKVLVDEDQAPVTVAQTQSAIDFAQNIFHSKYLSQYIATLVSMTRESSDFLIGASTRAAIALLRASKAHAALSARKYVGPADVQYVFTKVLAHRVTLARGGSNEEKQALLVDILNRVTPPDRLENE